MSARFQIEREGPVTIITIDRPAALNALDLASHIALSKIIDAFAADVDQRVGIITGQGDRAFCAGNDLKQQLAPGQAPVPPTGFGGLCARTDLDKPLIAAVNGLALGGGFELALACDLIVASERAEFQLPEARLGLAPLAGGALRLPALIGAKRAMELMLTGRTLGAHEAFALGVINQVTPHDDLLRTAKALAARVCESAPLSIRAIKALMRAGEPHINTLLPRQRDLPAIREMGASSDAREGAQAFTERRAPRWTGS